MREPAKKLGIYRSYRLAGDQAPAERAANRSFLISPQGEIIARYDKIHMFDVDLANGESYREFAQLSARRDAVVCRTAVGPARFDRLLRFALSRALSCARREPAPSFLAVPSAFTRQTGEAHWHVLLRARAIENGCYMFAAAQGGRHENGRETYGHSLIVDPWGRDPGRGRHRAGRDSGRDRSRRGRRCALAGSLAAPRPALRDHRADGGAGTPARRAGRGMIRYALNCDSGHAFESWFQNSAAYDKQAKRGWSPARSAAPPRSTRR